MPDNSLHIKILSYLKNEQANYQKVDPVLFLLNEDESYENRLAICKALEDLFRLELIDLSGNPHHLTARMGGAYTSKYHTGIKATITKKGEQEIEPPKQFEPIPNIYHHYNFQGAVNPIIGDNNIQSSKTRDIILSNNTNTNIKNQNTTQQPAKKWISDLIIGLIITVIGGLIVWYLTK